MKVDATKKPQYQGDMFCIYVGGDYDQFACWLKAQVKLEVAPDW